MSLMDNVKQLDSKQKTMLVVLIGCVGLVLYLVYTTFFASEAPPEPTPPPVIVSNAAPPAPADIPAPVTQVATAPQNNPAAVQVGQPAPATPESLALLAKSQQMQQEYIELVNQYQLAQLQQKLAQVDAQIAASKLTTTKSLVELKKLQPELGQMENMHGRMDENASGQGYQTLYVGQTSGRWQAMIQFGGQYFQVSMGMHLPDGSVVEDITNKGVLLVGEDGSELFLPLTKTLD